MKACLRRTPALDGLAVAFLGIRGCVATWPVQYAVAPCTLMAAFRAHGLVATRAAQLALV